MFGNGGYAIEGGQAAAGSSCELMIPQIDTTLCTRPRRPKRSQQTSPFKYGCSARRTPKNASQPNIYGNKENEDENAKHN
jgi:hypothetical protein